MRESEMGKYAACCSNEVKTPPPPALINTLSNNSQRAAQLLGKLREIRQKMVSGPSEGECLSTGDSLLSLSLGTMNSIDAAHNVADEILKILG